MNAIEISKNYPNCLKLDLKGLYLQSNDSDIIFTLNGAKIAELLDNGKVRFEKGVKKVYKDEINRLIIELLCGNISLITN